MPIVRDYSCSSSSRHVSSYGWVAMRHVARPSLQTEPRRHACRWRSPPARAGKDQSAGRAPAACSNCCKVTALGATSCARAASGHAAAAPPSSVVNKRRFMCGWPGCVAAGGAEPSYPVHQCHAQARPVVSRRTRFQADHAARNSAEERQARILAVANHGDQLAHIAQTLRRYDPELRQMRPDDAICAGQDRGAAGVPAAASWPRAAGATAHDAGERVAGA
jgi:hypothetical protein